ncbi:hypothetical protein [Lysobacter enzymogenes]|uniref:hypothetical protein n=1 Tax=Lysobacter enzymogenes TaxID=69 RepID=UPI001F0BD50C|nr:hypothetical protein [Lysobacter enzymogenes]
MTTTTPLTIGGGEVVATKPGTVLPRPVIMSVWPLLPKSAQGLPVSVSTAIRRMSSVASMMRRLQAPPSGTTADS